MKSNRKWVIALVFLLAMIGCFALVWWQVRTNPNDQVKILYVDVVHSDGSKASFQYDTSMEYLGEFLASEGLIQGENGFYTVVDGETADWDADGAYWAFYIEGEYAATGLDDTPILDETHYALEYTKDNFS